MYITLTLSSSPNVTQNRLTPTTKVHKIKNWWSLILKWKTYDCSFSDCNKEQCRCPLLQCSCPVACLVHWRWTDGQAHLPLNMERYSSTKWSSVYYRRHCFEHWYVQLFTFNSYPIPNKKNLTLSVPIFPSKNFKIITILHSE